MPVTWAISGLALVYLIQAASPLRTDSDAVGYLRNAAALADGHALPIGTLPVGYAVVLAALDRVGLGSSFFFIVANCFFLAAGFVSLWHLLVDRPRTVREWTIVLSMLAAPVIRSVAIPLPESTFFGASFIALWAATASRSSQGRNRFLLLIAAYVIATLAISVRFAGVALLPALLWSSIGRTNTSAVPATRVARTRLWPIFMALLVAAVAVVVLRSILFLVYAVQARDVYGHGLLNALPRRVAGFLWTFGEIVINLPFSQFKMLKPLFLAGGALSAAVFLTVLRRPFQWSALNIYLASYLVVLFVWPRDSSRLWMPIVPLLIVHAVSARNRFESNRRIAFLARVYVAWFVLAGLGALTYTTRISFAGDNFSRLYGNNGGLTSPTPPGKERARPGVAAQYDAEVRRLLVRYGGWHAAPDGGATPSLRR